MADSDKKKAPIIIRKKVQGAHGGAHGGAWKVAYADFVTAMMAFFLVMWLLGTDEEIKASVSSYFNNPVSALRPDLGSKDTFPLGEDTGAGKDLISGAQGNVPSDLIDRPARQFVVNPQKGKDAGEVVDNIYTDEALLSVDIIRLSIPENDLFVPGRTDQWVKSAERALARVGYFSHRFNGHLTIQTEQGPDRSYEFQLARAVSVARYVMDKHWAGEDQITTAVTKPRNLASAADPSEPRPRHKITFTLTRH